MTEVSKNSSDLLKANFAYFLTFKHDISDIKLANCHILTV